MFPPMRYLLDKNVVRHHLQGLVRLERGTALRAVETMALIFVHEAQRQGKRVFISPASFHILRLVSRYREVQVFLRSVEVLYPARYHKRWARRLREMGFTREDAVILSLGTFGTDAEQTLLGVHAIATFDQPLITKYTLDQADIQIRLEAMTANLDSPFCHAILPQVGRPLDLLCF